MRKIPAGWVFYSADFAIPYSHGCVGPGFVILAKKNECHLGLLGRSDVTGHGETFDDALKDACRKAVEVNIAEASHL